MTHPLVTRLLEQRARDLMARIHQPWAAVVVTAKEYKFAETLTGDRHKLFGYHLVVRTRFQRFTHWLDSWR
jgi:hypothetical protein